MGNLEQDINTTISDPKTKALLNIIYTGHWVSSKQNEFFTPFGISPQQYNILRILRGAGEPLKVQTIKDRMLERSPNATRLMDKLCSKKLISRVHCPDDRRVVRSLITDEGLLLLKKIDDSFTIDLLKNLTNEEALQLSNLLDKIR